MHQVLFGSALLISFLGGVVALLAPCCVSVMLPAFFAPGVLVDGRPFGYGRLSERRLRRALGRMSEETGAEREVTRG